MSKPHTDPEAIRQQLTLLHREPFRDVLASLLRCAPTDEALEAFAAKSPDRWAQALAIAARLSGYSEHSGTETTNIYMQVNLLSDGDLMHEYHQTMKQLAEISPAPVIEGQKVETAEVTRIVSK